ncbi:hypothetical protein DL98DRAFT_570551 [Cadophora sp. DSE1049]|nr:hypothetical protein DL98DRAFT_570551 [Cadophora sp. DSE1049]
MKALGALHLANTSDGESRRRHLQSAMTMYGSIIRNVRDRSTTSSSKLGLPDMATSLLLCLFEMMDSRTDGWKVHLLGASNIYNLLFSPDSSAGDNSTYDDDGDLETTHPVRRFLVSLLAYLDVAGSCATGSRTLVRGDYWESHGGGWEYNLGVPSFSHNLNDNGTLGQIRQSWSRLMSIQADISNFAQTKRQGMSKGRHEITRHDLESRLVRWRLNAPNCFASFAEREDVDTGDEEWYLQEAMGFVEAYEKATIIYLHKVCTTGQARPASTANQIQGAVRRILVLAEKYCTGVVQLGMPWALFMAGTEVNSPSEQEFVRQKFVDMARFGMMNARKALDALECTWLERERVGEGRASIPDFQSTVLLP